MTHVSLTICCFGHYVPHLWLGVLLPITVVVAQSSARNMHLVEDSVSLVLDAQVLDTPETGRDRSVYMD